MATLVWSIDSFITEKLNLSIEQAIEKIENIYYNDDKKTYHVYLNHKNFNLRFLNELKEFVNAENVNIDIYDDGIHLEMIVPSGCL